LEPVYSPNRLAFLLGIPRSLLEEIAADIKSYYRPFEKKRPGKRPRHIDNPLHPLKEIQRKVYEALLRDLSFPTYVQGGVPRGSPEANAEIHVGKDCVIGLDVAACYPSITNHCVFRIWRYQLGHSPTVAHILTRLTTYRGHLPQGAPTSSALANLALLPVLREIQRLAESQNLSFGQFVDDSGLSGDVRDFGIITAISHALSRHGLKISRAKVKVMRPGHRQIVTGHTVNTKVGIPREKRSQARAAVHHLENCAGNGRGFARQRQSAEARVRRMMRYHPGKGKRLLQRLEQFVRPHGSNT